VVRKNREILIAKLAFFMLVGSFGAFLNFINLYLEQVVGLTGSQIGFITFAGLIATVIMNPVWGYLADKTGKHVFFLKLTFLSAAIMGAIYSGSRSFMMIIIVSIIFEGMRAPIMPLLDYISTNFSEKYRYDYGKIRVFASLGFLLVAMATGFMVAGAEFEWFGRSIGFAGFLSIEFATFGIFIVMNAVASLLLFFLPKQEGEIENVKTSTKKAFGKQEIQALLSNRPFLFILILTMLGFMTLESVFSYFSMHLVTTLGASESIVSWIAFFMVTPELIVLPLGTVLITKFGFKNWYVLSFITMLIRLVIYSFTTIPLIFAAAGVLHTIMVVMHFTGTISYIRKVVPTSVLGLSFTVLASAMALSRGVLSFLFGWLYENINSFAVFQVAILLVLIGLIMTLKSKYLKEIGDEIEVI